MPKTLNNCSENLIIITAPSGAGKTTLIKNILKYAQENKEKIFLSIPHTTRKPRKGEINGKDYLFVDEETFNKNIQGNKYIEYAIVHENLYGTPQEFIDSKIQSGYKVLLEIDWQGALNVMQKYPLAKSIFISPPSIEELKDRLVKRGLDSEEVINKRVAGAALEMEKSSKFQYEITNISLDIANKNLLNIIFRENNG